MKLLEYNSRHLSRHDVAKGFEDANDEHGHADGHYVHERNGAELGHGVQVETELANEDTGTNRK